MKEGFLTIMDELQETDPPIFLAAVALCCIIKRRDIEAPEGYSRGTFKRAIRILREVQGIAPHPQEVEDAVRLIRRKWLRREDI